MNLERTFFVTTVTWKRTPIFRQHASQLMVDVLKHHAEQGKFVLHEFVIMSDHLHLLLTPAKDISLDHLQRTLKRNILRGREQQMQMVGHDDEFMQHEFALLCMVLEHIDHELRGMLAEDRGSFPCDRSDEERPL